MTAKKAYSWYNAALKRKKIAEAKRLKALLYIQQMNDKEIEDEES